MKPLAIIPARGGSKRIPGKNIKLFAGRPMIAYSIRAAIETGIFSRVIVSTDSEQIAEVARSFGAEIPFLRPGRLADDHTGTVPVLVHTLKRLAAEAPLSDVFCCIYATAPFISVEAIRNGLKLLRSHKATTVFSVTTFPYPIFRALRFNKRGRIRMIWPEHLYKRSQDLPEAFHDAGQFYWADTHKFLREKKLFSENSVPVILPRHFVQDIDTAEDWEWAEWIYKAQKMAS